LILIFVFFILSGQYFAATPVFDQAMGLGKARAEKNAPNKGFYMIRRNGFLQMFTVGGVGGGV